MTAAAIAVLALRIAGGARPSDFWTTETCKGCHASLVAQHRQSQHERSFSNPVFQAQYFKELLPRAAADPSLLEVARTCAACHDPIAFATGQGHITSAVPADPARSGVTCDVCHVITGFTGSAPGSGNFVLSPGQKKYGPFTTDSDWHHVYSELHGRSELCATCHEAVNAHGLAVKSTFAEWKRSAFAESGVQCQDCHMSVDGFLTAGKSRHESGQAAQMNAGKSPERDRLFTHRFPGAHSRSQVAGALALAVAALPRAVTPGSALAIRVSVDNGRTGHSMPTGSADLRLMWLEVTARAGKKPVLLPVISRWAPGYEAGWYEIAGVAKDDALVLGSDVPKGSRVYRAVFADAAGRPTLASYDAVSTICDTRLRAGERRTEEYSFEVPPDATGAVVLHAKLKYLAYPTAFTRRLGLPAADPVEVAATTLEVPVEPAIPTAR